MISIQPLQHLHFNQWLALWQSYLKFYKAEMSRIQSITSWNRITNPAQQDLFGFGIFKEDQLVGFVHLVSHPSTWTSLPYCYLQDLYVDENYRQQGLARQLIEYVYAYCKEDFDRVYWLTHETNQTAQYLYDRIASKTGFIQYKKSL